MSPFLRIFTVIVDTETLFSIHISWCLWRTCVIISKLIHLCPQGCKSMLVEWLMFRWCLLEERSDFWIFLDNIKYSPSCLSCCIVIQWMGYCICKPIYTFISRNYIVEPGTGVISLRCKSWDVGILVPCPIVDLNSWSWTNSRNIISTLAHVGPFCAHPANSLICCFISKLYTAIPLEYQEALSYLLSLLQLYFCQLLYFLTYDLMTYHY